MNITYTENIDLLKQELKDKGFYDEESQTYNHGMTLTPIKTNGLKSLSYCMGEVMELDNLEVLGDYQTIFADEVLHDKYKSVYPYDVELFYTDEDGVEHGYFMPQMIGVFC